MRPYQKNPEGPRLNRDRSQNGEFSTDNTFGPGRGSNFQNAQRTQGSRHRSIYNRIDGADEEPIVDRDMRPATFIKEVEMKTR